MDITIIAWVICCISSMHIFVFFVGYLLSQLNILLLKYDKQFSLYFFIIFAYLKQQAVGSTNVLPM